MCYVICFALSIFFIYIAQKEFEKKNKKLGIIFSIIGILIPCILAGLRDVSVGIDVQAYTTKIYNIALSAESLPSFLSDSWVEVGYSIFIYVIARIFRDIHWVLFFTELIMCIFIYLTAYEKRKDIPMYLVFLVYFCIFYNTSLSIMRQGIAMFIIMYSLTKLEKKNYILTIIYFILAVTFHASAIMAIPMYLLIFLSSLNLDYKKEKKIYIAIFSVLLITVIFYEPILKLLSCDLHVIPIKYYDYLNSQYVNSKIDINYTELLFKLFWICAYAICVFFNIDKFKKHEYKVNIYFAFLLIDFIVLPISFKISNASRITFYYGIPGLILLIPYLINSLKNTDIKQLIPKIGMFAMLLFYWFYSVILYGASNTYPYISDIIPFLK